MAFREIWSKPVYITGPDLVVTDLQLTPPYVVAGGTLDSIKFNVELPLGYELEDDDLVLSGNIFSGPIIYDSALVNHSHNSLQNVIQYEIKDIQLSQNIAATEEFVRIDASAQNLNDANDILSDFLEVSFPVVSQDLAVVENSLQMDSPLDGPEFGGLVTISWDIDNPDQLSGWKTGVYIADSSTLLAEVSYNEPAALSVIEQTASFTVPGSVGASLNLEVRLDPENDWYETDESNNELTGSFPIRSAELIPQLISTSIDKAGPGSSLPVRYIVSNQGQTTAQASWTDSMFLSPEGGGENIPLLNQSRNGDLAPGTSYVIDLQASIPATIESGSYRLGINSDVTDSVAEVDNSNILISGQTIEIGNPDLFVSSAEIIWPDIDNTGIVSELDVLRILLRIDNKVNAGSATGEWKDIVYLSNNSNPEISPDDVELLVVERNGGLGSGESLIAEHIIQFPSITAGPKYLKVLTDATFIYNEAVESDNLLILPQYQVEDPDLIITDITLLNDNSQVIIGQYLDLEWELTNAGGSSIVESLSPQWKDRVWLSQDTIIDEGTDQQLLDSDTGNPWFLWNKGDLRANQSWIRSASVHIPDGISEGTYYLIVETDFADDIQELDELNNIALTSTIGTTEIESVDSGFTVELYPLAQQEYGLEEEVTITGRAISKVDPLLPVPSENIAVRIDLNNNSKRIYTEKYDVDPNTNLPAMIPITTDLNGEFEFVFQPIGKEAGEYLFSAGHPLLVETHDSSSMPGFSIRGIEVIPDPPYLDLTINEPVSVDLNLQAYGVFSTQQITGIEIVTPVPGDLNIAISDFPALPLTIPDAIAAMPGLNITGTAESTGTETTNFQLKIALSNSEELLVEIPYYIWPDRGFIIASSKELNMVSTRDDIKTKDIIFFNAGKRPVSNIRSVPPVHNWISVVNDFDGVNIEPGEHKSITVAVVPDKEQPFGHYESTLQLIYDDSVSSSRIFTIDYRIDIDQEPNGMLNLLVTDEDSWLDNDGTSLDLNDDPDEFGKRLEGAKVVIFDLFDETVIHSFLILETGQNLNPEISQIANSDDGNGLIVSGLNEGLYGILVSKDNYYIYEDVFEIQLGKMAILDVLLLKDKYVDFFWNVSESTIEERYSIEIVTQYATDVLTPKLGVEPAFVDLDAFESFPATVNYEITNHGLIDLNETVFRIVNSGSWKINFPDGAENMGKLGPNETKTIPVTFDKLDEFSPVVSLAKGNSLADGNKLQKSGAGCSSVAPSMRVVGSFACGPFQKYENAKPEIGYTKKGFESLLDCPQFPFADDKDKPDENGKGPGDGNYDDGCRKYGKVLGYTENRQPVTLFDQHVIEVCARGERPAVSQLPGCEIPLSCDRVWPRSSNPDSDPAGMKDEPCCKNVMRLSIGDNDPDLVSIGVDKDGDFIGSNFIKITKINGGWEGEATVSYSSTENIIVHNATENGLIIQAIAPGPSSVDVTLRHDCRSEKDTIEFIAYELDVDVDSDNNNFEYIRD